MVLSNSILLQVSQKKTSYNDLLTKMLSNYSTVGSAKAALSRVLKNLMAFGQLEKKADFYYLTEKGQLIVDSKLKNKILISINNLLKQSIKTNSLEHVDDIVKNIQLFFEKGKEDPSLLKAGKTSSNFYVSDLVSLKKEINISINHYAHISEILQNQINIFQEQDFEDVLIFNLNKDVFKYISMLCKKGDISELQFKCSKGYPETINFFESNIFFEKKSDFEYKIKLENINKLKNKLLKDFELSIQVRFKVYINEVLVRFSFGKVYFFGPYSIISKLIKKEGKS
jgi:hypothetical protein